MGNISVSIIIPIYNVELYLDECLNSVFTQTFTDYEVVLINDGSTDRSNIIIEKYMEKYSNIILINQENSGQAAARNKGINASNGKYIYFLDSDDYIAKSAIEQLYFESEKNNLDALFFNGYSFYDQDYSSKSSKNFNYNYMKRSHYPTIENGRVIFINLIKNKDYTCSPCLFLIKKEVLTKNKLKFYEGIIQEDELFTFKLILICERVKVFNKVLFYRRIRQGSTMTSKNHVKSFMGYKVVFQEMMKISETINESNPELVEVINIKMSYIYGNILNQYIYMEKKDKLEYKNIIEQLNNVGKEKLFFNRKEYWVFNYSKLLYATLRKLYDMVKKN